MELIFVRHGQPAWTVDGLSDPDPHLTDLGREQAKRVAERLGSSPKPITELLVSPALRSRQTAEPIAAATGVDPVTVDDLVEMMLPEWRGEPEEAVQRIFAESRLRPPEAWWDGIEGGESFRDFHVRVSSAIGSILAERGVVPDPGRRQLWRHAGDHRRIAVVAHGGTNSVALTWLLGVEPTPWEWERFVLAHASIARIRAVPLAGAHVFSLRAFNDQEHLPHDRRSA